jgi:hypothetical protein
MKRYHLPIFLTQATRPRFRHALAVAVALAACESSLTDSGGLAVVPGTAMPYALVTINGHALPVEMRRDSTGSVSVSAGELTLGGSVFSQRLTLMETPPVGLATTRTSSTEGTITVNGNRVHFRASDGAEWEGTASPGWIVYTIPGNSGAVTFAFRLN